MWLMVQKLQSWKTVLKLIFTTLLNHLYDLIYDTDLGPDEIFLNRVSLQSLNHTGSQKAQLDYYWEIAFYRWKWTHKSVYLKVLCCSLAHGSYHQTESIESPPADTLLTFESLVHHWKSSQMRRSVQTQEPFVRVTLIRPAGPEAHCHIYRQRWWFPVHVDPSHPLHQNRWFRASSPPVEPVTQITAELISDQRPVINSDPLENKQTGRSTPSDGV